MTAKLTRCCIRPTSFLFSPRATAPFFIGSYIRHFTSSLDPRVSRMSAQPVFSPGEDPVKLEASLNPLIAQGTGKWSLTGDGQGIERSLKFKTFKAAWQFMNYVADECKTHRHHPEWSNVYNRVFVRWTTHNPQGLSSKDVNLAKICDEVATRSDSLAEEEEAKNGSDGTLRDAADEAARNAADCCKR